VNGVSGSDIAYMHASELEFGWLALADLLRSIT
jgi:hypothetical protein